MNFKEYAKNFLEEKPFLSGDIFETSIVNSWRKQKKLRDFNSTELTYYLFDNLYRSVRNNPEKMRITYDTLIRLNEEEKNKKMVEHLNRKKKEFFNTLGIMKDD